MNTHTPIRIVRLVVLNSGRIRLMLGGHVCGTYQSWKHWFANGISAYADSDYVIVHCVRGSEWAND